jgi:hypothetical protein
MTTPRQFLSLARRRARERLLKASCRGCGHARAAHLHYRRGTDCSLCDCVQFRNLRKSRWVVRLTEGAAKS